jgi:hypothetical protein
MLSSQCNYFQINYPSYFKRWINIKKVNFSLNSRSINFFIFNLKSFAEVTAHFPKGMMSMLNELNLNHTGKYSNHLKQKNI